MASVGGLPPNDGAPEDATKRRSGSGAGPEPTVLLVGAEQSFHTAIAEALARYGVYVETSPRQGVVETVVATAPDLVVLVGEAAQDGGSAVLASLHTSPHSSVVPVVLLADETTLDQRLRAFRHGAAAVIPRSASVDAIADEMARLAREIPERDGAALGNVGEATLNELVDALSSELRSGILSVRAGSESDQDAVRVVLGGGRPLAQTIDEFVSKIRRHVVHAEPLHYEFDDRAGGTIQLLDADSVEGRDEVDDVSGLRILLADRDAARADAVAQALRERGASVVVTDFEPSDARFARLRQLDPAILLIDEPSLRGDGYSLVRRMRRDTRLRWTALLVVRWEEVWSDDEGGPIMQRIIGTLATLAEPEQALRGRSEIGVAFDTRLEITGPARLMRALVESSHPVRATVHNPRVQVRVDFSDKLVAGARARISEDGRVLEGSVAIAALMVLSSGRVHVERIGEADLVNIMSPVDVTLNLADDENPPILPSLPAPPDGETLSEPPGRSVVPGARPAVRPWMWAVLVLLGAGLIAVITVISLEKTQGDRPESAGASASAAAAVGSAVATPSAAKQATKARASKESKPHETKDAGARDSASEVSEQDEAAMALSLESHRDAPTCEKLVGSSWSLLDGDQPGRALGEIRSGRRSLIVGKLDEAQMAFCRATVLDASNPASFTALVRLFLLQRDAKKARAWAERAAKHHPDDPDVQRLYGDTLARVGEVDDARRIWLESVGVSADDAVAVRGVAATYAHAGEQSLKGADYAQADRLFRRAALLDPSSASAAAGLARALLHQGEIKAALAWARRAVSLEPRDPEYRLVLGDASDKAGNTEAAYEAWRVAYEIDPGNRRAQSRMRRIPADRR